MTSWPGWAVMWSLAFAVYAACKWLSWRSAHRVAVPAWRHAAYLLAWPGLDADAFLTSRTAARTSRGRPEWIGAAARLAAGLALVFVVARRCADRHASLAGWIGMIGLILILHFGVFHLLSCAWRALNVQARPLMNHPLASTSLSEFWGRRWNTAFRDVTHRFLFRPLASRLGARCGLLAGFLVSGVVHDLVISAPSGGGYGQPTIYFAIQGTAVLAERSAIGRRAGLGSGRAGRLFTFTVLLAPIGLLFHRPFVLGVIVPFLHALGAL